MDLMLVLSEPVSDNIEHNNSRHIEVCTLLTCEKKIDNLIKIAG